ncbi:MAG: hypothetical protein K2K44_00760, partial [Oscillospiraceae bacterium]|nr:hypothetical protein [Oscillospiraceae bacterium]
LYYLAVFFAVRSAKNPMLAVGIAFVIFYTALGIFLKKHFEISEPKITWIQFGGFFTIISAIITLADVVIKYSNLPNISVSDIPAFALQSVYIVIAVPALILSLIIRLIIAAVQNKSNSK